MKNYNKKAGGENSVAAIRREYIESMERQQRKKRGVKIRLYRRLALFATIFALVMGSLVFTLINQKQTLAKKEQQKIELTQQLSDTQDQQEELKIQIAKLNDDDYIAKLARKELFLSEDGEIIFSIPKNTEKSEKNGYSKE
ncbi:septum formation initiator family protein [Viridibacillus sp. YIM B01967]|uniref:Septum formation initiator family protein n=1 Tax=Viridibacillus soli TaxID=2798301 RepID=A0ABS1HBT0_9BACL|nr:septum formation initiator family protein [Viridibacillus soli]MBK3496906.1 septum formation initiator family protein [Viridibacillus soli]